RQIGSDETVRVRTFQETLRADESVIYQQFVGLPPGVYTVTVTVRDRNAPASTRQERTETVPRFAGRALRSPIPVYEGPGRTGRGQLPKLLVNPRATLGYGGDPLRLFVEAYGLLRGVPLLVRGCPQGGTGVAVATVLQRHRPGAHDAGERGARSVLPPRADREPTLSRERRPGLADGPGRGVHHAGRTR